MFKAFFSTLVRTSRIYIAVILLFAVVSIWLSVELYRGSISLYSQAETSITQLQDKRKSISEMMRAARERMIILLQMYIENDVFERYNKRQDMNKEAEKYIAAKDVFENSILEIEELELFRDISDLVSILGPVQTNAAELMIAEQMDEVDGLLFKTAIPHQTQLMLKFEMLLDLVENETGKKISSMKKLLESNNLRVNLLIAWVVLGTLISFVIIISRSKKRENELKQLVDERTLDLAKAHVRTKSLVENASDGVISIDIAQNIVMFNPAAEQMFQFDLDEVIGKPLTILLPEKSKPIHEKLVDEFAQDTSIQSRMMEARPDVLGQRKDGSVFPAEVSISKSLIGEDMFFTAFVRDVTEKRKAEETIRQLARIDSLTGLYNRHYFESRLQEYIKYNKRFPENGFCLMLLDLDLFKQVNDTYGHPVGDKLLKHVAGILQNSVREVDDVGRIGGDEFAIILQVVNEQKFAIKIAEKLISEISKAHVIEGHEIKIGASIGMTFSHGQELKSEELLKQADKMLYASKEAGKNTYRIFFSS